MAQRLPCSGPTSPCLAARLSVAGHHLTSAVLFGAMAADEQQVVVEQVELEVTLLVVIHLVQVEQVKMSVQLLELVLV